MNYLFSFLILEKVKQNGVALSFLPASQSAVEDIAKYKY